MPVALSVQGMKAVQGSMAEKMCTSPGAVPRCARLALLRSSLRKAFTARTDSISSPAARASAAAFSRMASRSGSAKRG